MIVLLSSFLKISSSLAFSVLITLPLKGKIAWNFLSLPSLAEPPAESPSTRYIIHFSQYFYFEQVNFPDNKVSLRLFFLPERASSRALRAASLACCALIAFFTRES